MNELLTTIWGNILLYSLFISAFCFVIGIVESTRLQMQSGILKRGFKLASKPLTVANSVFGKDNHKN